MGTNRNAFEPMYAHCVALASLGVPPHQILAGLAAVGARFAQDMHMGPEWAAVLDVALANVKQRVEHKNL